MSDELPAEHKALIVSTVAQALASAPVRPDVKKAAGGVAVGVLALAGAFWTWAQSQTATVAKHDVELNGSGPTDPGLSQRMRDAERDAAAAEARRQDDHERLGRIEDSVNRIAERVGAKK